MKKDKKLALELLLEKQTDSLLTYSDIALKTGYSIPQLKRLFKELKEKDMDVLLHHHNEGKEPANKASNKEIEFLRKLKEPYPNITIAHFRDIYLEDIILNPDKQGVVKRHHLKPRSSSWFRNLFIKEGWVSPAKRKPLRRDGRALHPLRQPSPRRGELIQIDGTPYDWFQNGETWTLHLCVDDATSEPLAGWFERTERQRGYCYMMKILLEKYGIPMALYSDKHRIFKSSRDDSYSQFGLIMKDLGIEMIFANSAEAKGRIERYNGTVQKRLVSDIIRFKIKDYDTLNVWFNDFYVHYLQKKFGFMPLDPNDAFVPLLDLDLSTIFYQRHERIMHNDMFSFANNYYSLVDENGEIRHIINGTKITVRIDVFSEEMYVVHHNYRYTTILVYERKKKPDELIENQKDLQDFLNRNRK